MPSQQILFSSQRNGTTSVELTIPSSVFKILQSLESTNGTAMPSDVLIILRKILKKTSENVKISFEYDAPEPIDPLQNPHEEPEISQGLSNSTKSVEAAEMSTNWDSDVETSTEIPIMGMTTDLDRNSPEPDERFDASLKSLDADIPNWNPEQISSNLMPINYGNGATRMIQPGNHSIGGDATSLQQMNNTYAILALFGIACFGAFCYGIRKLTPAGRVAAAKKDSKLKKQQDHARSKRQSRENRCHVLSQMSADSTVVEIEQPQDL